MPKIVNKYSREKVLFWMLPALVTAAFFIWRILHMWYYTVDDAWITMRFARNIINGYGFVYNPGSPPVEGFTSPLLLFWQCLILTIGADGLIWTKTLGIASGVGTMAAALLIALDLVEPDMSGSTDEDSFQWNFALWAGPLALAASAGLVSASVAGLETSLFTCLVTWGAWGFIRVAMGKGNRRSAIVGACAFMLAAWTRPEMIVWLAALLAGSLLITWREKKIRVTLFKMGIAGLIGWLLLILWRFFIFGRFQPNTYYAKMGSDQVARFFSGLEYIRSWAISGWGIVWIVLALAGILFAPSGKRKIFIVPVAAVIAHFAIVLYEGGDWIPQHRFLTPMLGVLASLVSVGVYQLSVRISRSRLLVRNITSVILILILLIFCKQDFRTGLLRAATRTYGWNDAHLPMSKWLEAWRLQRGGNLTIALEDIGYAGWYCEGRIIDLVGLTDPVWGREIYEGRGKAKYPVDRLLDEENPEVIVLIATQRNKENVYLVTWDIDLEIFHHQRFIDNYTIRTVFSHKDYPGDGYYLCVYVRNDVFNEPPPIKPPETRSGGGWDKVNIP